MSLELRTRFSRPVFLWAAAALLLELLVERNGWTRLTLTLLPLVPMVGFIAATVRTVQRMDELQQRISLISMSFAFLASVVLTLVFIGLERARIYNPDWHELGTYMLALWGVAYVALRWSYR